MMVLNQTFQNTGILIRDVFDLVSQTISGIFVRPFRWKDFFKQMEFVAVQSAPIVAFCVCFAAVVTIIEASFHMKMVIQNDSLVPGFAALLILRELGSVVAALLMTSRVGAGLAAEVGTMKITEQIDALKMLNIDPVRFLMVPRFLACVIGGLLLATISNVVCLVGAIAVCYLKLGYSVPAFLTAMKQFVTFQDLIFAMIKGAVFGSVIPVVSCYFGFRCRAGAEGVGVATTNSVVAASVLIIILDFVMAWFFSYFY
jgi:phospholipid/cholesterol/gamma-HCH transport system permease protein